MFKTLFWKDVLERAVKTFAQTLAALLVAGPAASIISIDWSESLGVAALAAIVSVLTSVGSGTVLNNKSTVSPASAFVDKRGI